MRPARPSNTRFDLFVVGLVALTGVGLSGWLWQGARATERARDDLAFSRQVDARHALIRETLGGYEECLLAMKLLMTHGREIDQVKFSAEARAQFARHPGFLGLQWAPRVTAGARDTWERVNAAELGAMARIRERARGGADVVALARAEYFPILFADPIEANRNVIGSDAAASPLRGIFATAAASGGIGMSGLMKLVYESGPNDGVVMVCPVGGAVGGTAGAVGVQGFLLGVFRVADLLNQPWRRAPGAVLDVMFIDESSTRADRRVLFFHRARAGGRGVPTEAEFKAGAHRSAALPIAGRNWRVIYRSAAEPAAMSLGSPIMALVAGLTVTLLGTGFLASHFRRTRTVEREVAERTADLSESRRQLSALMHALPGMAFRGTYEDNLSLTFVSEGALALTGHAPAEFIEGRLHLRDIVHPDDLARVRGRTRAALAERREIEVEYRIRTRTGGEKWVLARGRGIQVAGASALLEGLAIDITAQKNAEAARLALERKLLEGQKLESLGLLAGGIAHDFNNLLSTVLGNAELARLELPSEHVMASKLRAIESASVRASELCRQMLAYAGKGRLVVEPIDLSVLTEDLLPLLKISIAHLAGLRLELGRGLPLVSADATQLRQIVMNLMLNATDAIAERGGEVVLTTGVVPVTPEMLTGCVVGADLPAGDYVFLEVRDTGAGMTPEVLAKIFDPFFTTKFAGRGLGLAAVLGIVRGHGGGLCVSSVPGRGSTFRLFLPLSAGPAPVPRPPEAGVASRWSQVGKVLVVDDEMQVRFVMVEMLRSFGFTSSEAADGKAALTIFRENPAGFELVVLDMLMPGLSGEQTLEALRGIRPEVRVLLVSGYSEEDIVRRLSATGPLRFLPKPFTRASLERELRQLLA